MKREAGAHTSPFPFPITPEGRAPAYFCTRSLPSPFTDSAPLSGELTEP
jgi:hypothetical protein